MACHCFCPRFNPWCFMSQGNSHTSKDGEHGGSVVERRTPEREVGGSKPTSTVFVLKQDTLFPESTSNTQEAVAPSRHD